MVYDFFYKNFIIIYFVYGLFFFLMGFTIAMQIRSYRNLSSLPLAKPLWLLAAFGISHGLSEWSVVFIPIQSRYVSETTVGVFNVARDLLVAGSFLFLFQFGVILTVNILNKYQWLYYLPTGVFIFWLLNFIAFPVFVSTDFSWWMSASETWTRYLLALPGAAVSSFALCLQYRAMTPATHLSVARNFRYAAFVFGVYAVIAGLIVPKAGFFPASVINVESFFITFHIPVQVFRAACGMAMAYFVIRALKVFDLENRKNLEEARDLNLLYEERNRIGRDLHDGIIQQIYAIGLQLENACYLVKEDSEAAHNQIKTGMKGLNEVVKNIRNYILDLRPTNFQETDLVKGLTRLIDNFRANSLIYTDFRVYGEPRECMTGNCQHIYHIAQEALNNILKHSGATMVEVNLTFLPGRMELSLKDNGQGFNYRTSEKNESGYHRGLLNMLERSNLMGAVLNINSDKGKGTEIKLILETGGKANEKDQDINCR